jgi:hypothetical protein
MYHWEAGKLHTTRIQAGMRHATRPQASVRHAIRTQGGMGHALGTHAGVRHAIRRQGGMRHAILTKGRRESCENNTGGMILETRRKALSFAEHQMQRDKQEQKVRRL